MNKEEFKQETLEEAAKRILANNIDGLKDGLKDDDLFFFYKGVIQCYGEAMAKWQQKRMYSESDNIMKFLDNEKHLGISDNKTIERIKWYFETYFEQFKKKNND